ncbi:MAG: beta-ketoacyl reductase, partial [Herbaspirillum sp.]
MARIAALRERGVHIALRQADLAQHQVALELVRAIDRDERPLRGVVHAAGVSEDQALSRIDAGSWQRVFDGKAQAALWLDEALASRKLDFFIGFSSVAAEFGSAGQGSYAAANALLGAVLLRRHARTGDGYIVHWGPWAGEGMANDARLRERWAQQGIALLKPTAALAAMARQLQTKTASAIIADIDWLAFVQHDLQGQGEGGAPVHAALCAAEALMALDGPQARGRIADGLAVLIGEVLKMDAAREFADRVQFCSTHLSSLGIDSLMGMELRNRVRAWVKVDLPAHVLIGGGTVQEVVELIQQKLLVRSLSIERALAGDDAQTDDDAEVLVL